MTSNFSVFSHSLQGQLSHNMKAGLGDGQAIAFILQILNLHAGGCCGGT